MLVRIAAAALLRADGATLLVRKRGTSAFMQPGGKIEGDETPLAALCRELLEELGVVIAPEDAHYLGRMSAPAAHETDSTVIAEVFSVRWEGDVTPQAEIEEICWVHRHTCHTRDLAPLTRDRVLPAIWP